MVKSWKASSARAAAAGVLAGILLGPGSDPSEGHEPGGFAGPPEQDLTALSIEELMDIQITSVSKREEALFHAPAAVFVLTAEDIRRSGLRTIPEALRLVPGVEVARIDSNRWAISVRGFKSQFANKLLVLVDGRSVYSPLFSGVYWETQDVLLEDVERIEVIRGPGASLWGANAVNGVINILTKNAAKTQGLYAEAAVGIEETTAVAARYGGSLGARLHWRLDAKHDEHGGFADQATPAFKDDWRSNRADLRLDWEASERDVLLLQGMLRDGTGTGTLGLPILTPPFSTSTEVESSFSGQAVLGRWGHTFSARSRTALQIYYDRAEHDEQISGDSTETLDADFQHVLDLGASHRVIWGAGYRRLTGHFQNSLGLSIQPPDWKDQIFGGFVQDELALVPDRLYLTLGSKFEHNDYTGLEIQPGLRLHWAASDRQMFWGSIARAVRTPSRFESNAQIALAVFPGQDGTPTLLTLNGSQDLRSEQLLAFEAGYRVQPSDELSVDLAAFYNRYEHLIRFGPPGRPYFEADSPTPHLVVPSDFANQRSGQTWGAELALRWSPSQRWSLAGGYSFLRLDLRDDSPSQIPVDSAVAENDPRHQFQIQSRLDLRRDVQLDASAFFVDRLPMGVAPAYLRFDLRLGWKLGQDVEVSVSGQNLFDGSHFEAGSLAGIGQGSAPVARTGLLSVRLWLP